MMATEQTNETITRALSRHDAERAESRAFIAAYRTYFPPIVVPGTSQRFDVASDLAGRRMGCELLQRAKSYAQARTALDTYHIRKQAYSDAYNAAQADYDRAVLGDDRQAVLDSWARCRMAEARLAHHEHSNKPYASLQAAAQQQKNDWNHLLNRYAMARVRSLHAPPEAWTRSTEAGQQQAEDCRLIMQLTGEGAEAL